MSTHDIGGLLRHLEGFSSPRQPAPGVLGPTLPSSRSRGLQGPPALTDEQRRFAAYWQTLERAIPEPPLGWEKRAKPPGSAPRTCGGSKVR